MDFKVAGDADGVTAFQMVIKVFTFLSVTMYLHIRQPLTSRQDHLVVALVALASVKC